MKITIELLTTKPAQDEITGSARVFAPIEGGRTHPHYSVSMIMRAKTGNVSFAEAVDNFDDLSKLIRGLADFEAIETI